MSKEAPPTSRALYDLDPRATGETTGAPSSAMPANGSCTMRAGPVSNAGASPMWLHHLSGYVNGVAERYAETSRRLFPGYRIHAITNGVDAATWTCPSFRRLYETQIPHWQHEPELLVRADRFPDDAVWSAHQEAKRDLLGEIERRAA